MRSQAIWHPTSLAVYIRQELLLTGTVNGGQLRCAANGPYAVYLNGSLVGRGLGGGMADIAVWEPFDLVALREGENMLLVFAVGAGEGDWFRAEGEIIGSEKDAHELDDHRRLFADPPLASRILIEQGGALEVFDG